MVGGILQPSRFGVTAKSTLNEFDPISEAARTNHFPHASKRFRMGLYTYDLGIGRNSCCPEGKEPEVRTGVDNDAIAFANVITMSGEDMPECGDLIARAKVKHLSLPQLNGPGVHRRPKRIHPQYAHPVRSHRGCFGDLKDSVAVPENACSHSGHRIIRP
jgi:hypothetical protein